MENERNIGRVLNVDSFRVVVEIDKDNKSLTKTHFTGINPIARINSYIIILVGFEKIVGHITKVQMFNEATEIRNKAAITLPDVKRLVWATMIGTLRRKDEKEVYEQGITSYPTLDNPVWFILKDELDCIFDKKAEFKQDDYEKGLKSRYYIPIGKSTAFPDYDVKIDPDTLFSKHLAVLGNTGSGKSCTIASLFQTILKKDFDGKTINNGHFVIFDTNGEYSNAFQRDSIDDDKVERLGNSLVIDKNGLKIPYWFMNFQDFINIFKPGEGAQLPVLSDSIRFARNKLKFHGSNENEVMQRLEDARKHYYNRSKTFEEESDEDRMRVIIDKHKIRDVVKSFIKDHNPTNGNIDSDYERYDIDMPVHFDRDKLLNEYIEAALRQSEKSNNKIRDYCSTMLMRMRKYFNDPRYDFMFHNFVSEIEHSLATFVRLLTGRMDNSKYSCDDEISKDEHFYLKKYFEQTGNKNSNHQVIVIDLSLIASDVLENVTALIGRLILDFLQIMGKNKKQRGQFPIVLVLEEAHNYIPEKKANDQRESISKIVFERIAREGRKFGLSLVVSSQRPSELSKTVLSQCNSFIVHKIQNPEDQNYIRTIVPSINEDLLKQLPALAQRTALIFGDCVRAPAQIYMNEANPLPDSKDPQFIRHWLRLDEGEIEEPDFEGICRIWEGKAIHDDELKELMNEIGRWKKGRVKSV